MATELHFQVLYGDADAGTYERAIDALNRAKHLLATGHKDIMIMDAVGRRYTPELFGRTFIAKQPPEWRIRGH